jgi:basic membrane protein A
VDTAAFDVVKSAVVDNNLPVGTTVVLGLSDEGVGYTLDKSNIEVSDDIVAKVEAIKEKVISGELVVPETNEAVADFLAANQYSE